MLAIVLAAHVLFLQVGGKKIQVTIPGPPTTITTTRGRQVGWSPADAEAIIEVLTREHLEAAIPKVLGGMRPGGLRSSCLTLDLDTEGTVQVTIPGVIEYGEDGRVAWSAVQIRVVRRELTARGLGFVLPRLFGLRAPIQETRGDRSLADTAPADPKPLAPACGECVQGVICTVTKVANCCDSGGTLLCTSCKVCGKKLSVVEE